MYILVYKHLTTFLLNMKHRKNLFNMLKFYITNTKGKKQLECKKNEFCDCSENLTTICVSCKEKTKAKAFTNTNCVVL